MSLKSIDSAEAVIPIYIYFKLYSYVFIYM